MNRPARYTYRKGCLGLFIGGFFFAPAIFLLVLAWLSRNGDYCARRAPPCLPSETHLPFYLVLGLIFLFAGLASVFVMFVRPRR